MDTLEAVYERAVEHAQERDEHLPTEEPELTIDGGTVNFHLDNSQAIYYELWNGVDDLVYVEGNHAGGPTLTKDEFVTRVQNIVAEEASRFE